MGFFWDTPQIFQSSGHFVRTESYFPADVFLNVFKYAWHLLFCTFQANSLSEEWAARADLPPHVVQLLNDFPSELHPMSQLSAAVTAMNSESHFAKGYSNGIKKSEFWEV